MADETNDGLIYVGDEGTIFLIDMKEDITTATDYKLHVLTPKSKINAVTGVVSGGKVWTPTIVNTNFLRYVTQTGDLDVVGTWKINPWLNLPDWKGHGLAFEFEVNKRGDVS